MFPFTVLLLTKKKRRNRSASPDSSTTSLQVECNKKFGYCTADDTLKTFIALRKESYHLPRVDTSLFLRRYFTWMSSILQVWNHTKHWQLPLPVPSWINQRRCSTIRKFWPHHAIIWATSINLTDMEKRVFSTLWHAASIAAFLSRL